MANASAIEQSRRTQLIRSTSLDRGAGLWASSSFAQQQGTRNATDVVTPAIPVSSTNRAWSPYGDEEPAYTPSNERTEEEPTSEEEGEEDDFFVDPLSGEESSSRSSDGERGGISKAVEDRAVRFAEKKAIAAAAGSVSAGTGAVVATAALEAADRLGVDPVQAGKDLLLLEQLNPFLDPLGFLWVNIKMIGGSWLLKDESKLIPGLTWSIKDILPVIVLHGFVLFIDLSLLFVFFMIASLFLFIGYAYYRFYQDPIGFSQEVLTGEGMFGALQPILGYLLGF